MSYDCNEHFKVLIFYMTIINFNWFTINSLLIMNLNITKDKKCIRPDSEKSIQYAPCSFNEKY